MDFLKDKARLIISRLLQGIRQSSKAQRIEALAPFAVAALFTAVAISLNVFLFEAPTNQIILDCFRVFSILAVFFAGITWITSPLVELLLSRYQEKRAIDVLWVGLYLPQAFITLVILYSQLTGSVTITGLSAALITWAMLSLILTPFSIVLSFLAWSFLPKELPDLPRFKKPSFPSRLSLPTAATPKAEVLKPIPDTLEADPLPKAKNENREPEIVDMGSRLNRVGQSRGSTKRVS
ncbi:hypothetical protein NBZ79_12635 [Sneathiella marina]|uniref:Yip1 domain-containing protein n=1 Tax=Sneathiella marina TaxID=2950108 RepID=A0ABY4VZ66_9PROT|nr:hypothetical protein [Sneathiella marina]USG60024.1 hypothetical protein NBZ79_12635 [Sneathiella marina]